MTRSIKRSQKRGLTSEGSWRTLKFSSWEKDTLILHRLCACFRVPGIVRYLGGEMPSASAFQQVCRLCAKAGPLKGVRVRLRPRRLQTKIEPSGEKACLARQPKSSCVTVHLSFGLGVLYENSRTTPSFGTGERLACLSRERQCNLLPITLTAERSVCFPREKEMNLLSQFLYGALHTFTVVQAARNLPRSSVPFRCLHQPRLHDGGEVCLQAHVLARRCRSG